MLLERSLNILEKIYVVTRENNPVISIVPIICPKVIRSPKFEEAKKRIGKNDKNIGVIK